MRPGDLAFLKVLAGEIYKDLIQYSSVIMIEQKDNLCLIKCVIICVLALLGLFPKYF